MIARTIIELAKDGERNVEVLCEAALNAPAGAISSPNAPPLHRRRRRILEFEPCARAAGDVGRAEALAHNALEPELAGVPENDVARLHDVFVEE